eukprot:c24650_g2_i1 orf=203-442(+)
MEGECISGFKVHSCYNEHISLIKDSPRARVTLGHLAKNDVDLTARQSVKLGIGQAGTLVTPPRPGHFPDWLLSQGWPCP